MSRTLCGLFVVLYLTAVFTFFGQGVTGTLIGTVTDASGAVVPNAAITLTNAASGDVRKTTTNAEGYFTIAAIATGTYNLSVTASGFQTSEQKGIVFNGADTRNVNIALQVGTAATRVEVISAQATVAPVDTGEKSEVLNTKELQDFSVVGRSAAEFIKILPGMAQSGNGVANAPGFNGSVIGINGNGDAGHQSALGYYSANGTPVNSMDITADGAHVSDPGCNCATPVNPNTDMIQEMKVFTSNFNAENSKGPVVINTIAKSGTRDFHGEGYLYARNYALNAGNWLDNARGVSKPADKFFFPGGNIGGPVLIPGTSFNHNRDKLFFFTGYEYFYQTLDTGQVTASVPTQAMRAGDFSAASISQLGPSGLVPGNPQPVNTALFPNGQIPKSSFDPGGAAMMNLYPLPNANPFQTGGYNYVDHVVFNQNGYQWMTRADYSISDNTKLFVRYNLQNELQQFPVMLWWRANPGDQVPYPTPIHSPNQSQSVSADLTHVFGPSLTNEFIFGYTYIDFPNEFADPSKVDRTAIGYPYQGLFHNGLKQIPNILNWGNQTAFIYNPGGFEAGNGNLFAIKHLATFGDNLSKVLGTHTMKFGAYYEHVINNQPSNNDSQGDLTFDSSNPNSSGNAYADMLLGQVQTFSQANYNVLHNEAYNTLEFFAQDSWKIARRLTVDYGMRFQHLGQWYDRQGLGFAVWNPATYTSNPSAYLPGIAWNKIDSSVPISGLPTRALFYAPRFGLAWDIFGTGKTVLRGGWGAFRFHSPQSTDGLDTPTGAYTTSVTNTTLATVDTLTPAADSTYQSNPLVVNRNDSQQPVTYSYSFTISQQVFQGALLELSYVGNQSKYLFEDVFNNLNALPYGKLFNVANNTDSGVFNALRPFNYYQDVYQLTPDSYSNYNGFQASFKHQRGRFNYMFNYTFSKAMGINNSAGISGITSSSTIDRLNMANDYGPLPFDRRHIFNAAYSLELGSPLKANLLARGLVNGWQISGITQWQSGVNLQMNTGNSNFNLGGINPITINGTPSIQVQPVLTCNPTSNLGPHQYINASCFSAPTPGNNGAAVEPEMFGPSFFDSDLSLFKNFQIGERQKLQFRFSAYNFLNHPVYSFGYDNNLNISFDSNGKVNNPLFGTATNKVGSRVIQLAVKYYF